MSMRRPRIKPSANLTNRKQKAKSTDKSDCEDLKEFKEEEKNVATQESVETVVETAPANEDNEEKTSPRDEADHLCENITLKYATNIIQANETELFKQQDLGSEHSNDFKCPPKIDISRSNSHLGTVQTQDDANQFEEDIIHMDLQRSISEAPMSPSKHQSRPRMRPIPIFGQRRNSFIPSSPSPHTGDEVFPTSNEFASSPRRERYISGSQSQTLSTIQTPNQSPYRTQPSHTATSAQNRIRTESICSTFSDSHSGATPTKSRKTDDNIHRSFSRRNYESRLGNGLPNKATLKMGDLIYYNPTTNPMTQKSLCPSIKNEPITVEEKKDANPVDSETATEEQNAIIVPQLKLNANGELILDDKSLEIETTAEQEARKVLANSSLIYIDEHTGMNGFYKRHERTKEWPPDETVRFYRCLQTVGTDFSLMCQLFPKRTRRDLKLKFKKEERCNEALINKALLHPNLFNIEELKQQLAAEDRERKDMEMKWKEIKAREPKNIKKIRTATSKGARNLTNGDEIYENENVPKDKFSKLHNHSKSKKAKEKQTKSKKNKKSESSNAAMTIIDKIKTEGKAKDHSTDGIYRYEKNLQSLNVSSDNMSPQQSTEPDSALLENALEELLYTDTVEQQDSPNCTKEDVIKSAVTDSDENSNNSCNKAIMADDDVTEISDDESIEPLEEPNIQDDNDELNAKDVEQILRQLADGSMVLVSTLDPEQPDREINEIYNLDQETGNLCDTPLDIPDVLVQCILTAIR